MSFDGKGARIIFMGVYFAGAGGSFTGSVSQAKGMKDPSGAVTATLAGRGNSAIG
jgi:hypothetical protein